MTYKYAAIPPVIIKKTPQKNPKTNKNSWPHILIWLPPYLYIAELLKKCCLYSLSPVHLVSSPMNPLPSPWIHQNGSWQAEYTGASWNQRLNSTILQASSETTGSLKQTTMEVFTAWELAHTTNPKSSSEWKSWPSPSFIINYQSSDYLIYWQHLAGTHTLSLTSFSTGLMGHRLLSCLLHWLFSCLLC